MNERLEKIKTHVIEHKTAYISVAVGVVSAGFTYLIMRGRHAGMQSVPDGPAKVTMRPFLLFSSKNNIVTVVEQEGRGHPGYVVRCLETGLTYSTQGEAARAYNVSPSMISSHINRKIDNVNGLHFERVHLSDLENA